MRDRNNIIAGLVFLAGLGALAAQAQETVKFTEDTIRAFIEKTTAITSGKESGMSEKEIGKYLDMHLHPDARFKSTMRYAIPGYDAQEKTMSIGKDDFIEGVHQGENAMKDYESETDISDIKISQDGRAATLETTTRESGMMPVEDEGEKKELPVEGVSSCTQILMLSDENVIQMYNATCTTEIEFKDSGF